MKIIVKWGSQTFPDVEVDEKETLEDLQIKLFSLTNVPIIRQKIFLKGKWIKDNELFKTIITSNTLCTINLLGTADEVSAPKQKVVFEEDLPPEARTRLIPGIHSGLINLGNTCYMNSIIQALRVVSPLKEALKKYIEQVQVQLTVMRY